MNKKIYIIVFILLYSTWSNAQNLTFDLPFISENAEPELFFLDPNYDENYNIDYYSLGDMMRVKYEYNGQRRPIQKILSVMDKYDRRWEKLMITDYEYDKDGKTVSEKTIQYYGKTRLYELTHTKTYDTDKNIDTTRTNIKWFETRFESQLSLPFESGYTIRYLNKHNLPDSTSHVVEEKWYSYTTKQYYTYDDNRQLIHCKAFRQYYGEEGTSPLKEIYSYDIKYGKNKIEYIQTMKVPDVRDEEDYYYHYENEIEIKLKDEITKYTITTDNNKRILTKQLMSDKKIILDSKYSYTAAGQTNANMEMTLTEKFMKSYGLSGMGGSLRGLARELEDFKYTIVNKDNSRHLTFYLKKQKRGEVITSYYPDGQLSSIEMLRYDEDGEKDDHDKDEYRYLANGLIEKITYSGYYDSPELEPRTKYLYKENAEGKTIYEEEFSYDDKEKQWTPHQKSIFEFDQYGYLSREENYKYEHEYNSYYNKSAMKDWQGEKWTSKINDANQRTLEEEKKRWKNGKWVNYTKRKYAYNDEGLVILNEKLEWNDQQDHWVGTYKDSTFYYPDKNIEGEIRFKWQDDSRKWELSGKTETEKTEPEGTYYPEDYPEDYYRKKKVTFYTWIDGQWQPEGQRIDNKGAYNSFYSYAEWDGQAQDWKIERKEIEKIDHNGIKDVESYTWQEDRNQLAGTENTRTIPLQGKYSYNNKRIIYRVWNYNGQSWNDTIACNIIDYSGNQAYIYERYNKDSKHWEYDRKVEIIGATQKQSTITQSLWDSKNNKWASDKKIVFYFRNNSSKYYKSELYIYDHRLNLWMPFYSITKSDGDNSTLYEKWDSEQNKWSNYFVRKGSGWYEDYYQWNENLKKFVKKEYYDASAIIRSIDNEFNKIDTSTSYYSVINANR